VTVVVGDAAQFVNVVGNPDGLAPLTLTGPDAARLRRRPA
jgi:hypothetical protein